MDRHEQESGVLRRYTDLPALLHLLHCKQLTLLDPAMWDDTNDSHYLTLYREKRGLASVLALCFTQANETYHHWRVFAGGSSGVCVCFDRTKLVSCISRQHGLRHQDVTYLRLEEIRDRELTVEELPFLKRHAFQNEAEFRLIYDSKEEHVPTLGVKLDLACIDRIVASPWIPKPLFRYVKDTLRAIPNCSNLRVTRSNLIANDEWKRLGEDAVHRASPRRA